MNYFDNITLDVDVARVPPLLSSATVLATDGRLAKQVGVAATGRTPAKLGPSRVQPSPLWLAKFPPTRADAVSASADGAHRRRFSEPVSQIKFNHLQATGVTLAGMRAYLSSFLDLPRRAKLLVSRAARFVTHHLRSASPRLSVHHSFGLI